MQTVEQVISGLEKALGARQLVLIPKGSEENSIFDAIYDLHLINFEGPWAINDLRDIFIALAALSEKADDLKDMSFETRRLIDVVIEPFVLFAQGRKVDGVSRPMARETMALVRRLLPNQRAAIVNWAEFMGSTLSRKYKEDPDNHDYIVGNLRAFAAFVNKLEAE